MMALGWWWASLVGCGTVLVPAKTEGRPSIVLVTLDTTRADHIGAYGYERAHTPVMDALAADGLRFEAAYTTVPLTTPAHASILTGLYPARHGIHTNGDATLPDEVRTLPEHLASFGYRSAASVGAFVTTRMWNLDQGFDAYFDAVGHRAKDRWHLERPAREVTADLVDWLDEAPASEPFFVWAHYYDPHDPHVASQPWPPGVVDAYDAEIAEVDQSIGLLLDKARAVAGEAGVLVVVVGDHGEALKQEHGEYSHGLFLYEPTVRVPFIVSGPTAQRGRVETEAVSVVDVLPTTLGWLELPVPSDIDGIDLSTARRQPLPERAPVVIESNTVAMRFGWHPEVAVVDERDKLMPTPSGRLYDLALDPEELHDRLRDPGSPARDARVAELRAVADAVRHAPRIGEAPSVAHDAAVEAQLAALGYLSGDGPTGAVSSSVDAKDRLDVIARLQEARELEAGRQLKEAREAYEAVIASEPTLAEARLGLATVLRAGGAAKAAFDVLDEALAIQPDSVVLRMNRAKVAMAIGQVDDAESDLRQVLDRVPEDETVRRMLLQALAARGSVAVTTQITAWRAAGHDAPYLDAFEGDLRLAAGDVDAAEHYFERASRAPLPPPGVHRGLAAIANLRGETTLTGWHLSQEVALYPDDPKARRTHGDFLMAERDWLAAAAAYEALVRSGEADPDARRAWAQAEFNAGHADRARRVLEPVLGTEEPQILALQANILAALGRPTEAASMFARAQARVGSRR